VRACPASQPAKGSRQSKGSKGTPCLLIARNKVVPYRGNETTEAMRDAVQALRDLCNLLSTRVRSALIKLGMVKGEEFSHDPGPTNSLESLS
jgi:hypothetical protein